MCRHYSKCLDRAVDMDWKGFACSDCRDYELEAGEDRTHWQQQELRAAYLLLRIATGDPRYHRSKYRTPERYEGLFLPATRAPGYAVPPSRAYEVKGKTQMIASATTSRQ